MKEEEILRRQTASHSERRNGMDNDFLYYAFALVALVVGLFILKKVATCLVKTVVGVILVAVLAAIYWLYLS